MPSFASLASTLATGVVLLAGLLLLIMAPLEHGNRSEIRLGCRAAAIADARGPTLAPPIRSVVVRIETNQPELEIGWLENF